MFIKKLFQRSMLFVALVGGLTVCGIDSPSAPVAPPQADLLGIDLTQTVSSILHPLACDTKGYGSVTKTIGSGGGYIIVGPHSFVVPPNALSSPVAITATAPAGNRIEMQFQPAGLTFDQPTALTLSYKECGILVLNPKVVYIDDDANILEQLLSLPNLLGRTVTGKVKHFSGYAVAE